MNRIEALAATASKMFTGIDWQALSEKNGHPVDEQIWYTDYIYGYMLPAFDRMMEVVSDLQRANPEALLPTLEFQEATHVFDNMWGDVDKVAPTALERVKDGLQALLSEPFKVPLNLYKSFLYWAWDTASVGVMRHIGRRAGSDGFEPDYMIHNQGYSNAEIVRHAVYTTTLCEVFPLLDKFGALDPLRTSRSSTSGLGAAPIVIGAGALAVLGIVQIVIVALIAWALVAMIDVSQKNKLRGKVCSDIIADPNASETLKLSCTDLPEFKPPLDLTTVFTYAGIAIGAYFLVTLLPDLLRSARETRAIVRET